MNRTRRGFLADVGAGMFVAGIGPALATDLGLCSARAAEAPTRLDFGKLEPLVALMQDTAPAKLLPMLTEKLQGGTSLFNLVSAAALANARTFGGEDCVGFHTLMALSPAYEMSKELPEAKKPLPIFKVLYRNSTRLQEKGGSKAEVLHAVKPAADGENAAEKLREAARRQDLAGAESIFAASVRRSAQGAFNDLLLTLEDETEVHRVVMVARAWELSNLVGLDHAHTFLRQSVHYCVNNKRGFKASFANVSRVLPAVLDQYHLVGRQLGRRSVDDAWVEHMSRTLFKSAPDQAADAAAAALAEGVAPEAIGEAIALAANQLVLRDNGRPALPGHTNEAKPVGSVHGDGIGVHASDSANAWRYIAGAANPRHAVSALILGAYQVANDRVASKADFQTWEPYPRADAREKVKKTKPQQLLAEAEEAIRGNDQARTCALIHQYGVLGQPARPVLDLLLRYAISEDGALHAEKYYRTASQEFARTRPAFRWRQLVALARVTASEYGRPAPGYKEACGLLKV